jgi:hypothetical protein
MTQYPWHVKFGTLMSQSVNALLLGGHPDMSLSTRAELEKDSSRFWALIYRNAERLFGEGHCRDSLMSDIDMALFILEAKQK